MRIFMDELLFSQPTFVFRSFSLPATDAFRCCLSFFTRSFPPNLWPFIESVPLLVAKSIFELLRSVHSVSILVCLFSSSPPPHPFPFCIINLISLRKAAKAYPWQPPRFEPTTTRLLIATPGTNNMIITGGTSQVRNAPLAPQRSERDGARSQILGAINHK